MIKLNGTLNEELLEEGWIACKINECGICNGSGWSDCGHAGEGKPGERSYMEAQEGTKCGGCEGAGYILDLDTAIACKVRTHAQGDMRWPKLEYVLEIE